MGAAWARGCAGLWSRRQAAPAGAALGALTVGGGAGRPKAGGGETRGAGAAAPLLGIRPGERQRLTPRRGAQWPQAGKTRMLRRPADKRTVVHPHDGKAGQTPGMA